MWFYFAILSAIVGSIATIARHTHGSTARPVELAWWTQLLCLPFSLTLVLISHQPLFTSLDFLMPTLASAAICSYASVLQYSAYKYGEVSVINPLSNLMPLGLLVASFIMFGTLPSGIAILGIVLIAGGVYYASISGRHSLLKPFTAIWHQRGSRAMLGCIIIWSVSTNLDKIAIRSASPAFYLLFIQSIIFIFLSMYLVTQPKPQEMRVWRRWKKHIITIASFTTLSTFLQLKALALTSSSLVFAVKRIDTLIVILFAGYFLHEKHILKRFKGALIAVAGVVIIYLVR